MRTSLGVNGLASSINLLLPDALATGKLDIVSNAIVREISVDKNTGLVNGAHFVDRHSRREMHVKAKVVVLAAGTLESTRLLLNSGLGQFERRDGPLPARPDLRRERDGLRARGSRRQGHAAGLMGGSAFMPRFRNLTKDEKRDFIKGYCMMISSGGGANPNHLRALWRGACRRSWIITPALRLRRRIYGERVARFENHVRINKEVKDAWGIPVLHIEAQGRRERAQHG